MTLNELKEWCDKKEYGFEILYNPFQHRWCDFRVTIKSKRLCDKYCYVLDTVDIGDGNILEEVIDCVIEEFKT